MTEELRRTALYDLHVKHGAKMVPFAGYEMPVQYPMGVMQEHLHTRGKAGLFDVSHMGQVILRGSSYEATAMALEKLIPMDVLGLPVGRQRYGLLTNEEGGLRDDLMFANREDDIYMVVNAGCKEADIAYMRQHLESEVTLKELSNRALLALQGPLAQAVLASITLLLHRWLLWMWQPCPWRALNAGYRALAIPVRMGLKFLCQKAPFTMWQMRCWTIAMLR